MQWNLQISEHRIAPLKVKLQSFIYLPSMSLSFQQVYSYWVNVHRIVHNTGVVKLKSSKGWSHLHWSFAKILHRRFLLWLGQNCQQWQSTEWVSFMSSVERGYWKKPTRIISWYGSEVLNMWSYMNIISSNNGYQCPACLSLPETGSGNGITEVIGDYSM